ncbi:MAG TPA: right-handed parallel beta-helix repeat-containing protein [Candidatus Hydrogenedentes bacterium]|nr:right-handed parallel beta-helix repeat-containing protein [Candidatus Hydrogenedentota bacterium]HQM49352.1 right-handed parallel beta-helix repeat-containing protein [Candidatus Hydrogenedentota bacterium]
MRRMLGMLAAAVVVAGSAFGAQTLYVATNGNDAWSGKLETPNADGTDGPFATLQRAREAVRAIKAADGLLVGGIEVIVAGGIYVLDAPFELTAEDSGTAANRIVYRAADGAEVRLLGGKVVNNFQPVTDQAVLDRLDESARGHVLQADLKALGITDFGAPNGGGIELFFADKPMTVSRWPNEGFVRIQDIVVDDGHQIHGNKGSMTGKFVYEGDRPARWLNEEDPWLHGYWFWDWSDERKPINNIDIQNHIIELAEPPHGYGYRKGQWYYAFNMLTEIDAPGEWHLNRETGTLYFWPPAPIDSAAALVSVIPTIVSMNGASFVTFRGFTFEACRSTACVIREGVVNRVAACVFRNGGAGAVSIGGGTNHGVVGCDIYQMAGGGISINGGDRTTLAPASHFADNNHIHHYARWYRVYHSGIQLSGVGNRASHNLIHDAPHMGMGFGGNDHLIEFNELYNVCFETNDAGAIYTGRDWTMRGNLLRYNYLHDITGFENRGCVGIYLDDMFASADMIGNVFYNVTRAAFIGGGRDCTVANNIFVNCNPAMHLDARALGWAHGHADGWIQEAAEKGTLCGIAYNKPPYSERYPALVTILDKEPKAPEGNVIARNICWGGEWDGMQDDAEKYVTLENNLIQEDPHFMDADNKDFRLKEDSPAFALGFEPIPIEKIGLYESPDRASWPVTR